MTLLFYELKLQLKEIKTRSAFWLHMIVQLCCLWAEYYFYVLILYNFNQLYGQQSITQNSIVWNFALISFVLKLATRWSYDTFHDQTSNGGMTSHRSAQNCTCPLYNALSNQCKDVPRRLYLVVKAKSYLLQDEGLPWSIEGNYS